MLEYIIYNDVNNKLNRFIQHIYDYIDVMSNKGIKIYDDLLQLSVIIKWYHYMHVVIDLESTDEIELFYRSRYSWQSDDIDGANVADNHCWNTLVPFSVTSDLPLFVINWPSCVTTINVGIPDALNRSVRSLDAKNDKINRLIKLITTVEKLLI